MRKAFIVASFASGPPQSNRSLDPTTTRRFWSILPRLELFSPFPRGSESNSCAHDGADQGPDTRQDDPGCATDERAGNCAVSSGPSFGLIPEGRVISGIVRQVISRVGWSGFISRVAWLFISDVAHVASSREAPGADVINWLVTVSITLRWATLSTIRTNAKFLSEAAANGPWQDRRSERR
jgi:hypothetical protein